MHLTYRELWTVLHGMGFGTIFLLGFAGGMAGLYSLRSELITPAGVSERLRRMKIGLWAMAVVSWLTAVSGTWVVYVWYRAKPVPGVEIAHYSRLFWCLRRSRRGGTTSAWSGKSTSPGLRRFWLPLLPTWYTVMAGG